MAIVKEMNNNNITEDTKKLELSFAVGGKVKWHRYCGKVWHLLKKLNRVIITPRKFTL